MIIIVRRITTLSLIFIAIGFFLLSGHIYAASKTPVMLDLKITNVGNMRIKISGTTNLPNGMSLSAWVEGITLDFNRPADLVVKNGRFESEVIGPDKGLLPGYYAVEITSLTFSLQPDSVRATIGKNGNNLIGKVIKNKDGEKIVETRTNFQLTKDGAVLFNKKAISLAQSEIREKVQKFVKAIKIREVKGRALESLRKNNDPACMRNIQNRKKEAEDLRARIEGADLPLKYSMPLGMAATELSLCITCSETLSMPSCNKVLTHISEVEKQLKQPE